MERLILQITGGGLYLLNKVFLNVMERSRRKKLEERFWFWKKMAWVVYLAGLTPIVIIFFSERNWIFGIIELGGAPAMLCGLISARTRKGAPKWLDRIALAVIPIGLGYSLYDFGGITTLNQLLEIAGSTGFLVGTYLLSKDRSSGYRWFVLMNAATAWLLYIEGYPLFVPQQILSAIFVTDAHRVYRSHISLTKSE